MVQIFRASPMLGLALCLCLATILWCIILARRQQGGLDKVLTGLLGLISIYQALHILKDAGFLTLPILRMDAWVDFIVAGMYLIAAVILKISSTDRVSTKVRLRLVEANEKTLEVSKSALPANTEIASAVLEASPLAMYAVDPNGSVSFWNAAAERLFGWKREEVLGQKLPFATSGQADSSAQLRNKQGHEIEAAVWSASLRSPNGSVRGTLTVVADSITLQEATRVGHASRLVHA